MSLETELAETVNKMVMDLVKNNLAEYLREQMFGWHSTLFKPMLQSAVSKVKPMTVVTEAVEEVVTEPEFKAKLKEALRNRLVNDFVKAFPLENVLKEIKNSPEAKLKVLEVLEGLAAVPKRS